MGKRRKAENLSNSDGFNAFQLAANELEDVQSHHKTPCRSNEPTPSQDIILDDEREYLAAIKAELKNSVDCFTGQLFGLTVAESTKTILEPVAADDEDRDIFFPIWDRLEGREIIISKDKELSFILEYLLRLTGSYGLRRILSALLQAESRSPETIYQLACHFCSSHIMERIFDCAVTIPRSDPYFTALLKDLRKVVGLLTKSTSVLFEDSYGVHVVEKLLLKLCFVAGYSTEKGHLLCRIFNSSTKQTIECTISGQNFTKLPESLQKSPRCFDSEMLLTVLSSCEAYLNIGKHEVSDLLTRSSSVNGSVLVQTMLVSLSVLTTQPRLKKEETDLIDQADSLLHDSILPNLVKAFPDVIFSKYGSRVAEMLIICSDRSSFANLVQELTQDATAMARIISDPNAHHSLIKIIEVCADMPLLSILINTVCENIEAVIMNGRSMIIVKIAQKLADKALKQAVCGKYGSASEWSQCQKSLTEALKSFYIKYAPNTWDDGQKRDYFVVLAGAFFPRNFSAKAEDVAKNMTMPGSQILQAICNFKDTSVVTNSILKLNSALLLECSSTNYGSFLIETLLKSQRGHKNFYSTFVKNLSDLSESLVLSKSGSRVFDALWKAVDIKQREVVAEKMLPMEGRLRTNEFGRFLLPKLNLNLFRRNKESWRIQQKHFETQKEDLKAILELAKKSKI